MCNASRNYKAPSLCNHQPSCGLGPVPWNTHTHCFTSATKSTFDLQSGPSFVNTLAKNAEIVVFIALLYVGTCSSVPISKRVRCFLRRNNTDRIFTEVSESCVSWWHARTWCQSRSCEVQRNATASHFKQNSSKIFESDESSERSELQGDSDD